MAGKSITQAGPRVAYAVDHLSKNTLADLLLDRIRAEIGEDASDEEIIANLQAQVNIIARCRNDSPVNLSAKLAQRDAMEAAYLARQTSANA